MDRLNHLTENLTLDQVASMSDAEVVRRRFDRSNIRFVAVLSVIAFLIAVGQFLTALFSDRIPTYMRIAGTVHFIFAFVSTAFFGELAATELRRGKRKPRLPVHLLARNFTPWVLTFVIVEFTCLVFFRSGNSDAWMGWAMTFPWVLIVARLELARRVALHISLLVSIAFSALLIGSKQGSIPEYTSAAVVNAMACGLGALASRRLRRQTLEEWTERREQAREQLRMRDELQFAREVQLSMIPEVAPSLPWVDLAGASLPATEVGGDYFDYFPSDGAVTIVTGDIAGHGLASGIVLASLRAGFMLLRDSLDQPSVVLRRLSDLVAETSRRRMLATAAVLRIDEHTRQAVIASAGHPPILFCRDGASRFIELFAPPLGVRLPHQVPSVVMAVEPGDIFILHSDGVYETQDAGGEIFGLDRLAALASTLRDQDAAAIRDTILRELEMFRGGAAQADDVTIVVARVR